MMKNLKKTILAFLIIGILFSISIRSFASQTAVVIKEDIKLRKEMSENTTILELIPKGEKIEVVQKEEGNWYQVRYLKIRGYVLADEIEVKEDSQSKNNTQQTNNTVTNTVTNTTKDEPIQEENDITKTKLEIGDIAIVKEQRNITLRPVICSNSIEVINANTELTILQIINNWAYVTTAKTTGWIPTIYLANKEEITKDTKQQDTKSQDTVTTKTGYISSDSVNFRKEASTDATVLNVFNKNDKITILGEQDEWVKASYNSQVGYVAKQFVSEKKIETTSRSSEKRETTISTTTVSTKGQEVVEYAKQFLGSRYVYGGETPAKGFDCSGLTKYVYQRFGVTLTHSATAQSKVGTKVEKENLQPGDLVFFSDYKTYQGIGHCGIYIGNNLFIHASTESTGVITSSLLKGSYVKRYVTATRVI